jgi:hypothetical protein
MSRGIAEEQCMHEAIVGKRLQRLGMGLLLFGLSTIADLTRAQNAPDRAVFESASVSSEGVQNTSLPNAPSITQEGTGRLSGTVLDPSGAAVKGAEVTLTQVGETRAQSLTTREDGSFAFNDLPPGSYSIAIKARGFQPAVGKAFEITAGQLYEIPAIRLSIATATTDVTVQPAEVIAAQQIKAEERQRVLGIIPNFYTSYVWNAAPLNAKQKYSMALRNAFDPMTFVGVSIGAGIEQAKNTFPGYGQGAQGYGKRWGALFANGRSSELLSKAVFPSLFHQDPRYFYQGSGSTLSRAGHAVSYAFVARSDSGHLKPNYSYFLGDLCSGALSNLYYPASSRGANLVFTNAAIGIAGRAGLNLAQEFLFKRVTKHVTGNGKPLNEGAKP